MKKTAICLTVIVLAVTALTGCDNKGSEDPGQEPMPPLLVADYVQSGENTKYTYAGEGNEYASYVSWVDYKSEDRIQLRANNGGTEAVNVYKIQDGKLVLSFRQAETYHRENMLGKEANANEILLMEPLEKGNSWTLDDGSKRSITGIQESVETPSGIYKAIEVTTVYADSTIIDYYAKGIGLVKTVFTGEDDFKVTSTLSKIEKDVKLLQKLKLYYPNIDTEKYYSKNVDIQFETNDSAEELITKLYKENIIENTGQVLSENAKINKISLEQEAAIVHVDLNREFLTEMNAGSAYEAMILQCLANTLGEYCMSEKMSITIDGESYSSGHIVLEAEDYITTDKENVIEVK